MASCKCMILAALLALCSLTAHAINMESLIDEENAKCQSGTDNMACIKVRAMRFVDTVMTKDNYKVGMAVFKIN